MERDIFAIGSKAFANDRAVLQLPYFDVHLAQVTMFKHGNVRKYVVPLNRVTLGGLVEPLMPVIR